MHNPKKVLVTGASGFIAKHIILLLLQDGYHVTGSVRSKQRAAEVVDAMRPHFGADFDLDAGLSFVELDLNEDAGWTEALAGIDVLLHTASPVPTGRPDHEDDVIRPALDGTLRALRAASANGVKRVILTSSIAAIAYRADLPNGEPFNEDHWSDITHPSCFAYAKSKTLAEKAAWEFVETKANDIELTTINPGFAFGPPLDSNFQSSMSLLLRLLAARDPALPRVGFNCVDVRDIARMHVQAIRQESSIGQRIIGVSEFLWVQDIAEILKSACPDRKIVKPTAPNWLIRLVALFDRQLRLAVPSLGRETRISARRAREMLDMEFIGAERSIRDASTYIVEHGLA